MSDPGHTSLRGKLALVTGASAGIGRAIALALAREGVGVMATGRRSGPLDELVAQAAVAGGGMRYLAGDLTDEGFAAHLAHETRDVDIFVNSAGLLTYAPFVELTRHQNEEMFQVNVLAGIRMCQLMGAAMTARARGHIVLISSLSYRNIQRYGAVYGATKHAMAAIAKGLRVELGGTGIKVTEVAPGMVSTGIRERSRHPEVLKALESRTCLPLLAEDVAQAVLYALGTAPRCCPDLIELRPTHA